MCWCRGNYFHDTGGTIDTSGWGLGVYIGTLGASAPLRAGRRFIGNSFVDIHNTVSTPGPSSAISGATFQDTVMANNYIKNCYNITGGQLATGTTATNSCSGLSQNITVTGNTLLLTGSFGGNSTTGIEICSSFSTVSGNTVLSNNQGGVIIDAGSANNQVTGNTVINSGSIVSITGVSAAHSLNSTVTGNGGSGNLYGILITDFVDHVLVANNNVYGNTTPVSDSASSTTVTIINNPGYNPTGVSKNVTVSGKFAIRLCRRALP